MLNVIIILLALVFSVMHFFITKNNQRYLTLGQAKLEVSAIKAFMILSASLLLSYAGMGLLGLSLPLAAQVFGQMAGIKEASYLEKSNASPKI